MLILFSSDAISEIKLLLALALIIERVKEGERDDKPIKTRFDIIGLQVKN